MYVIVALVLLDILLVERFPEFNRATLQRFIKDGRVKVDGAVAKKANEKYDRAAKIDVKVIITAQHQVFGRMSGKVIPGKRI